MDEMIPSGVYAALLEHVNDLDGHADSAVGLTS